MHVSILLNIHHLAIVSYVIDQFLQSLIRPI